MSMPPKCKFFLDPLKVLRHHKSCLFHPSKTNLEWSNLQPIFKYITWADLIGMHDSLVDCKQQTAMVGSEMFFSSVDKPKSIFCINKISSKHEQSEMKKQLEPAKPFHETWVELDNNNDLSMWN